MSKKTFSVEVDSAYDEGILLAILKQVLKKDLIFENAKVSSGVITTINNNYNNKPPKHWEGDTYINFPPHKLIPIEHRLTNVHFEPMNAESTDFLKNIKKKLR